jgi:hypothetical protein
MGKTHWLFGCAILVFAFAKYQNIEVANHMY